MTAAAGCAQRRASAALDAVCYTSVTAVLLISSPLFSDHVTPPGHPESTERADVFDSIAHGHVQNGGRLADPRPASRDELLRVHTQGHIGRIEETRGGTAMLDSDTFTSPKSASVARLAAGAAVQAAEHALRSRETAFALVRPPGHHAERERAMGFCLYNNVAVAAAAVCAMGVQRVAIVDIDVHHGNGTQAIFEDDPRILYVSTHQYPYYPGTGGVDEVGTNEGKGFTVNVPLEAGAGDDDFALVYDAVIEPVLDAFRPELLLVSAGYDAHERDPLGGMRLSTAGYARITGRLASVAERAGSGLAMVTEGGYDLGALSECLEASVEAVRGSFAKGAREFARSPGESSHARRGTRAIAAVKSAHRGYWRL